MDYRSLNEVGMAPANREDGWEISGPQQAGFDPEALAAIADEIDDDQHGDFHALLIARRGRLVFEAYFNGYDAARLHDIRSAGKSFTATLIGIAIDQGAIPNADVRMLPYFPNFRPHARVDPQKEAITVRHLLMMTSGFDADDADPATPGCEDNMLKSDDWIRCGLDLPMARAPGEQWVYAGVNTMLLAGLLEAATQGPLIDFASEWLFGPLGIDKFHWQRSPRGIVAGQGFLSLRGRDQLKLGQLHLDNGVWGGKRIVSEQWVRAATKHRVDIPNEGHAGYGYQWWRMTIDMDGKGIGCFFASGNGGNKIYVLPSLGMVVGTASSAYGKPYMHTRSHTILRRVIQAAI
ncbi:serine hydrolase [Nitratireductor sp. XY-223]|uniref:serine hydrolase domain-containing protein n=1 Tax=Nitratireductor sp. XY-223 TaxID=2561926 RepID=UPI0010AA6029|nr:serine hydrolase [Nitratireductor sp. XY-223]